MKTLVLSTLALLTVSAVTAPAFASGKVTPTPTPTVVEYNCTPSYGGTVCPGQNIIIDKTVKNPDTNAFVDNLGTNDPKYNPTEVVSFTLKVTNPTNQTLQNVVVTDTLPAELTYVNGLENAKYDVNARTVTFTIAQLNAGETKTYTFNAKLADHTKFTQPVACDITNRVTAKAEKAQDSDEARFCVEIPGKNPPVTKGGQPVYPTPNVTTTPPTGAGALLALIPMGLAGIIMRRKNI